MQAVSDELHGALERAAYHGELHTVKNLLAAGADANAGLEPAACQGHMAIVELLHEARKLLIAKYVVE